MDFLGSCLDVFLVYPFSASVWYCVNISCIHMMLQPPVLYMFIASRYNIRYNIKVCLGTWCFPKCRVGHPIWMKKLLRKWVGSTVMFSWIIMIKASCFSSVLNAGWVTLAIAGAINEVCISLRSITQGPIAGAFTHPQWSIHQPKVYNTFLEPSHTPNDV